MNIFFDVDETMRGYDGPLRPLGAEVFGSRVDEGPRSVGRAGVGEAAVGRARVCATSAGAPSPAPVARPVRSPGRGVSPSSATASERIVCSTSSRGRLLDLS